MGPWSCRASIWRLSLRSDEWPANSRKMTDTVLQFCVDLEGVEFLHSFSQQQSQCPLLMLWTAPPPGTAVPSMWVLLRPPRFGGASYADGHHNRSRYRKVGFSGPRRGRGGQCNHSPPGEASLLPGILCEVATVSRWH